MLRFNCYRCFVQEVVRKVVVCQFKKSEKCPSLKSLSLSSCQGQRLNFWVTCVLNYGIDIPATKVGKHQVLKLVQSYLSGETLEGIPNKGAGVYLELFNELGVELRKGTAKNEPLDTRC